MKTSISLHKTFWQNPYVDIFKHFPISDKESVDKQGEISELHDKHIAKRVVKISGTISGANYINIPSKKHGTVKSLGLNGRYFYIGFLVPAGGIFSFHLEFKALSKHFKFSFSNLFKTTKVISDTNIQVPFTEPLGKWSIICIDNKALLKEILELNQEGKNKATVLPSTKDIDIEMVSLQLCAKMFVRGVYTSDNLYNPKTLPKEMGFRLGKTEVFEQSYNWYTMNAFLNPAILAYKKDLESLDHENKENSELEANNTKTFSISAKDPNANTLKKSILKKSQSHLSTKDKRSTISEPKAKPFSTSLVASSKSVSSIANDSRAERLTGKYVNDTKRSAIIEEDEHEDEEQEEKVPISREVKDEIEDIDEEQTEKIIAKNIKFKSGHFTLEPNPIMALTHFQGFQSQGKNLLLVDDNSIVYSCGNTICLMDFKSKLQRFFIGQKDCVRCLGLHVKQNVLVSVDDSEKNSKIYLWTLYPQTLRTSFFSGMSDIKCCDLAIKIENQRKILMLLIVGKDQLKRDVITLYDITDFSYKEPYAFCKKISDFDIRCARFLNKNDATQFVSCGKESIRFWRLKHKVVSGTSLVLNEHGRDTVFNDFCIFDYEDIVNIPQEAETRHNYKVMFSSNRGNVYMVDYKEETLFGVFKLHDGGITSLKMNPTNHYFITAGEDKMVRLWNMDVTQMLLEIKVDSQVNHLILNSRDEVLCGCLNGTIGELKLDERNMNFIVRSHCDSIIMMDYHSFTGHLITISTDLTIKVWEMKTGYIIQSYEFRCLDEQVSFIRCFHNKGLFVCGFESGSLRVFDLLQSCVVCELDSHKKQVIDIAISPDDRYLATGDLHGVIQIFNSNLQFTRNIENDLKYQAQTISFDCHNEYLLTRYNPNTLKILKAGTWEICYTVAIQEEIVKASFSPIKHDLFILTSKSQLKKCRLQENNVSMEREYWTLHNGMITDFQISKNAAFIFTVGEDNLLKVWDYFMRGNLMPSFQAFTVGGRLREIVLSNDDYNLVFSYGLDNNGIFCWQFYSDLVGKILDGDYEDEEIPVKQEKPLPYDSLLSNREPFEVTDGSITLKKALQPLTGEVKSIYHEAEDILHLPSKTVDLKDGTRDDEIDDNDDDLNSRDMQAMWKTTGSVDHKKENLPESSVEEVMSRRRVTFDERQKHYLGEENMEETGMEADKFEESLHRNPATYRLPGQHMSVETVIGASFNPGCGNVVWNLEDNYIAYALGSSIIITYLEEPKIQKQLSGHHSDDIHIIKLSSRSNYLVSASGKARNEASCTVSIWDASKACFLRSITHGKLHKIFSIDVSPCENYILVLGESSYEDYALIFIWELQSGSLVSNTLYTNSRGQFAKWNNKIKGSLEFTLLTEESVTFWRLNHIRSLEYQEAVYDKYIMKGHKFISLDFLESKLFKDTSFMLVGTSLGSLMIFDTRSNTLLFTCNKFMKGSINLIFALPKRLTLGTEDAGIYTWKLEPISDPSQLAKMLEDSPDILLVDSKPLCGSFLSEKRGDEGLIATKGGVVWYINWDERATLRLATTHVPGCAVTALKAHNMDNSDAIISSGTDGTVRVWDLESLEQRSEFYVPRREALCIDIFRNTSKCVCGFSDGYIRFFDYEKDINYGGSLLRIERDGTANIKEDRGFAVSAVSFLNNGRNILAGNMNGEVYMIYVKSWENIRVEIRNLISNVGFGINNITLSELEPWDTWILSTKNRKVMVWNRKDLIFGKKDEDYYDKLFASINDLEYYLIDNYRVQKKEEKEVNYENLEADPNSLHKYEYSGDTVAKFTKIKPDLYVAITNQLQEVFFRDYKEHMVIKVLKVNGLPRSFLLRERENEIIIGTQEGCVKFLDYELGLEKDSIDINVEGIKGLELSLPGEESPVDIIRRDSIQNKTKMLICSSRNGIVICRLGQ